MKNQGWWCLLPGISFLTSLGFTFVVGDQYLQSFEFNKVTTSVAIKCGKPQSLSLHKIVAQQPSISGQTRADVVKTITTEFSLCFITYYCFCSDKLTTPRAGCTVFTGLLLDNTFVHCPEIAITTSKTTNGIFLMSLNSLNWFN